jgi:hypothetical protein
MDNISAQENQLIKNQTKDSYAVRNYAIAEAEFSTMSDKTGLFYSVQTTGETSMEQTPTNGTFICVGADPLSVNRAALNIKELCRIQNDPGLIYPKCSAIKFNGKASDVSHFLDLKMRLDFINFIFKKYGKEVPERLAYADYIQIWKEYDLYYKAATPQMAAQFEDQLKYMLDIICSEKTQEEYEKENGTRNVIIGDKKIYKLAEQKIKDAMKPSYYKPIGKTCVKDLSQLEVHTGHMTCFNVREECLEKIEKELMLHPEIKYYIAPESVPSYAQDKLVQWHMVSFRSDPFTDELVSAIVHKYELGLDKKAKIYNNREMDSIGGKLGIASDDAEDLFEIFDSLNIDYYLDLNSVYSRSTPTVVGLVFEDKSNYTRATSVYLKMLEVKKENSIISEEDYALASKFKSTSREILTFATDEDKYNLIAQPKPRTPAIGDDGAR